MTPIKLATIFSQVKDPRRDLLKLHELNDILLISTLAVICGADTWKDIETFATSKEEFLQTFLELPNGIPKLDTYRRVFAAIDSECFENCFIEWVNSFTTLNDKEVVAIDGKTIRGAKSGGKKSPIHMVSAWASEQNIVLGQVKTQEKSNEITAIPELLNILSLENTVVTIDAMGCQKEIATAIIKKDADYILAVKENQKKLYQHIQDEFRFGKNITSSTSQDLDHGRIETRICSMVRDFQFINPVNKWESLTTVVKIESIREFKNSDKPTETATRYYISSLKADAEYFQRAIRSHWGIENKLHWTLDVAFSEDASRKRIGNSAQNFSMITKIALNLLKNEKTAKQGVKGKRLKAGWDNQYLLKILNL
jgi:predicted transposase YbfD/YdcC